MAKSIGIHVDTFNEYKKKYSEFADALKKGKVVVDDRVVSKLLQRADGFEYEEVKKETVETIEGKELKLLKVTRTIKQVVPDTTAQIFWLKNRRPDEWRDKSHLEHGGKLETEFSFGDDGRRVRALVAAALARISGNGKNKQWLSSSLSE